jgi:hypothetical protein
MFNSKPLYLTYKGRLVDQIADDPIGVARWKLNSDEFDKTFGEITIIGELIPQHIYLNMTTLEFRGVFYAGTFTEGLISLSFNRNSRREDSYFAIFDYAGGKFKQIKLYCDLLIPENMYDPLYTAGIEIHRMAWTDNARFFQAILTPTGTESWESDGFTIEGPTKIVVSNAFEDASGKPMWDSAIEVMQVDCILSDGALYIPKLDKVVSAIEVNVKCETPPTHLDNTTVLDTFEFNILDAFLGYRGAMYVKKAFISGVNMTISARFVNGDSVDHGPSSGEILSSHMQEWSRYNKYSGKLLEFLPVDDRGNVEYSNGWSFVGTFRAGERNGLGKLTSPDGNTWIGSWRDGKRTNEIGRLKLEDGETYRGVWKDGEPFVRTTVLERARAQNRRTALLSSPRFRFNRPYDNIESIIVEKSGYDRIVSINGEIVLRKASPLVVASVQQLFKSTNPAKLGVGRDSSQYVGPRNTDRYHRLVPIEVFDVDYSKNNLQRKWERSQSNNFNRMAYCITKKGANPSQMQAARRGDFGKGALKDAPDSSNAADDDPMYVHTRLDRLPGLASQGVQLENDTNEKFLLHGTTAETILPMLLEGPTNKYVSKGAFGKAVYFAEDVGKSDQYCRINSNSADAGPDGFLKDMLGIKPEQYEDAVLSARNSKDVFYMFVVRVALGCPAVVNAEDFWANRAGKEGTPAYDTKLFFDVKDFYKYPYQFPGYSTAFNIDRQFQSVVIDDWGPNHPLNMRYREFMVYNGFVAKVTHLVAYKRLAGWPKDVPRKAVGGGVWAPDKYKFDDDPLLDYTDPLDKNDWKKPAISPDSYDNVEFDFKQALGEMKNDASLYLPPVPPPVAPSPPPATSPSAPAQPGSSVASGDRYVLKADLGDANRWTVYQEDSSGAQTFLFDRGLTKAKAPSIRDIDSGERENKCMAALRSSSMAWETFELLSNCFQNRFWGWEKCMKLAGEWPRAGTKRFGRRLPEYDPIMLVCTDVTMRFYYYEQYDEDVITKLSVMMSRNVAHWSYFQDKRYEVKFNPVSLVPKRIYDKFTEICKALKKFYHLYDDEGLKLDEKTTLSNLNAITF